MNIFCLTSVSHDAIQTISSDILSDKVFFSANIIVLSSEMLDANVIACRYKFAFSSSGNIVFAWQIPDLIIYWWFNIYLIKSGDEINYASLI